MMILKYVSREEKSFVLFLNGFLVNEFIIRIRNKVYKLELAGFFGQGKAFQENLHSSIQENHLSRMVEQISLLG